MRRKCEILINITFSIFQGVLIDNKKIDYIYNSGGRKLLLVHAAAYTAIQPYNRLEQYNSIERKKENQDVRAYNSYLQTNPIQYTY